MCIINKQLKLIIKSKNIIMLLLLLIFLNLRVINVFAGQIIDMENYSEGAITIDKTIFKEEKYIGHYVEINELYKIFLLIFLVYTYIVIIDKSEINKN